MIVGSDWRVSLELVVSCGVVAHLLRRHFSLHTLLIFICCDLQACGHLRQLDRQRQWPSHSCLTSHMHHAHEGFMVANSWSIPGYHAISCILTPHCKITSNVSCCLVKSTYSCSFDTALWEAARWNAMDCQSHKSFPWTIEYLMRGTIVIYLVDTQNQIDSSINWPSEATV